MTGDVIMNNNGISLEEKIDILFDKIESTVDFWDDDAANAYRIKMRTIKIDIENTLKEKMHG